jgi:hypothetical protein
LVFVRAISRSEETKILHENVNRFALSSFTVSPLADRLSAFDEKRVAFTDVLRENLRLFAGRGDVIPVGFFDGFARRGLALVVAGERKVGDKSVVGVDARFGIIFCWLLEFFSFDFSSDDRLRESTRIAF